MNDDELVNELMNRRFSDVEPKKMKMWKNIRVSPFTFKEYQENAAKTALSTDSEEKRMFKAFFGLAGEAGECSEAIKKYIRGDYGKDVLKEKMAKELGDVLWYISEICTVLGFSLEDIAKQNNEKLLKRLEKGTIQGSGDDR